MLETIGGLQINEEIFESPWEEEAIQMQDMFLTAPEVWGPQMDIEPSALQAYFSEPLVSYDGVAMRAEGVSFDP